MIIKIKNPSNDAESLLEPYREIMEKYRAMKCSDNKRMLNSSEQDKSYITRIK